MEQYEVLENAVLNCLIVKPELFKIIKLSEKHFKKHRRFYKFLKEFYDLFGKIDFSLIKSCSINPSEVMNYVADIIDTTSIPSNFELYEERLLKFYNQFEIIEEINKLNKKLYLRDIDIDNFKIELKEIIGEI
ncbi:MAG: hypothetical protein J6T74_01185 [Clostridia bacterium]|nr:hypothetical protein [Clostridia bacterium]